MANTDLTLNDIPQAVRDRIAVKVGQAVRDLTELQASLLADAPTMKVDRAIRALRALEGKNRDIARDIRSGVVR